MQQEVECPQVVVIPGWEGNIKAFFPSSFFFFPFLDLEIGIYL